MNVFSCICYLYRDAANYKQAGQIYLTGELSADQVAAIKAKLYDGENFIPHDLNLDIPELQVMMTSFPGEDDHVFHTLEIDSRESLQSLPEGETSIPVEDFVAAFASIADSNAWQIAEAEHRLGLDEIED